ncbi:MAG TPA: ankyrin repeat domain-containing protein [Saprospiraceae bacterium]|nr:ankyrin repeat domain-containing protein [Saprospiraceae bacterium]
MKNIAFSIFAMFLAISLVNGQASIQNAIDRSDFKSVKEWIQSGHDVNSPILVDDQKISLLGYASLKANPEMVSLLLSRGAQVNQKIEFQDALMYAAMGGNIEIIEALLAAGANPMNENKIGKCARDLAKDHGHGDAHRLLASETEKRLQAVRAQRMK